MSTTPDSELDELVFFQEACLKALLRITQVSGTDNRLILQGNKGFIVVQGECDEAEVKLSAAAGRSLDRRLSQEEAQQLYDLGYRRKTAALPFTTERSIGSRAEREALCQELCTLMVSIYSTELNQVALHESFSDRPELANTRLIDAMKRLSKQRDMSSRQKVYWGVVRAQVILALEHPAPSSLSSEKGLKSWVESALSDIESVKDSLQLKAFPEMTAYRSVAIFTDLDALDLMDPRGLDRIVLPGRLAIMLALAQGWDSLLINPRSDVGGEFYRNELTSIVEGLERIGW